MQAWASPCKARPVAMRGIGRSSLARNGSGTRSLRCNNDKAAAASPTLPVIQMSSPTRAPSRRNARPGSTRPCAVTHTDSGPCVVSPPTSATSCSDANAKKPSRKPSTHARSGVGNDSDSVHHAGCAPIAARSERLTASAFQPMSPGAVPMGKCTPSLSVSIATTSCMPSGTCSKAASSPMPSTTSPRDATRSRMRAIRSNSRMAAHCRDPLRPCPHRPRYRASRRRHGRARH